MTRYVQKTQPVFDVDTFDEFIQYGRDSGVHLVNGMPWHFHYKGYVVTHETDDRYIINIPGGSIDFWRGHLIVIDNSGKIFTVEPELFAATYEPADA